MPMGSALPRGVYNYLFARELKPSG